MRSFNLENFTFLGDGTIEIDGVGFIDTDLFSELISARQDAMEAEQRGGVDGGRKPPTAAAAPCSRDHQQLSIDMPWSNKCPSCGIPLR